MKKLEKNYKMRHRKYKCFVCACVIVYIYYFFGVGDYVYSRNFEREFDYPLNVDIKPLVQDILRGQKPSIDPINYYPYRFLSNSGECSRNNIDLFIAVKSAMGNFGHRDAIRKTYGRTKIDGKNIKTMFFLGIDGIAKSDLQKRVDKEMVEFKDVIQMDFLDKYYNNTIKTMMTFRWLYEHCSEASFYLFTDDDMYISVKNLVNYTDSLSRLSNRSANELADAKINVLKKDKAIFSGYVFESTPQRFRSSKWRVSLQEYPWNKWPPYVTAGAYVVTNKAMKILYVGSLFVKHFRFDDIYLGIVAKKVGIQPRHCPQFHFYKKTYSKEGYRDLIASHGYGNHEEMIKVWKLENDRD